MSKKNKSHDSECECLAHPGAKCNCEQGEDRKMLALAKNKVKRRKHGIEYGLANPDFLSGLLSGKVYIGG